MNLRVIAGLRQECSGRVFGVLGPTNRPNLTNFAIFPPSGGIDDDGRVAVEEATHVLYT